MMSTLRYPLRTIMTYSLPDGGRSLVLIQMPDGEHPFALIDVPADGPLPADRDCVVVDHTLDEELDAYGAAIEHMRRSEALGRPAQPA